MDVGLQVEQVAVQVQEKWRQSGWVSARKQRQKTVRGPWVWGGLARSDRGFEGNRHGLGRGIRADSGGRSMTVL